MQNLINWYRNKKMNLFKKKKTTKIKKHSLCSFQNEPYDDRFIQKYKIEMKIETK